MHLCSLHCISDSHNVENSLDKELKCTSRSGEISDCLFVIRSKKTKRELGLVSGLFMFTSLTVHGSVRYSPMSDGGLKM